MKSAAAASKSTCKSWYKPAVAMSEIVARFRAARPERRRPRVVLKSTAVGGSRTDGGDCSIKSGGKEFGDNTNSFEGFAGRSLLVVRDADRVAKFVRGGTGLG